jgi:hypothetical protein
MELLARLFQDLLLFVYHCFARVVIPGYLSGLSRPEQAVYFFRDLVGEPSSARKSCPGAPNSIGLGATLCPQSPEHHRMGGEGSGAKKTICDLSCAPNGARSQHGVYFILKSMEQGNTLRSTIPNYPTADSNYRILAKQRSRFTHYYHYIGDEALGTMVMRVASFFSLSDHLLPERAQLYRARTESAEAKLSQERQCLSNRFPCAVLQAAADRFTPELSRQRLEYWTLVLRPKFCERERGAMNLRRF